MVVYVATVAQGIHFTEGVRECSGDAQDVAVGIVFVVYNHRTASIHDGHDIALEIGDVVVHRAVVVQCIRLTTCGIEEVDDRVTVGFSQEFTAGVHIGVLHAVDSLAGTNAVSIVGIADAGGSIRSRGELSAILPSERPSRAIVVA